MKKDKIDFLIKEFCERIIDLKFFKVNICGGSSWKKYFISSGYPEIIIFAIEAKKLIKDISFNQLIIECMLDFKNNISEGHQYLNDNSGIVDGYCGIGYMTLYLLKNNISVKKLNDSVNINIKNILENNLKKAQLNIRNNEVNCIDYDVIYGLSSSLRYLLEYKDQGIFKDLIKNIIKYLMKLIEDNEYNNPQYYIKSKNLSEYDRPFYPDGAVVYGISHGIAGILSSLSIAIFEGVEVSGMKDCVNKILEKLELKRTILQGKLSCWPDILSLEQYKDETFFQENNNYGWCYGICGTARAVYLGGLAINEKKYIDIAIDALISVSNDIVNLNMDTSIVCHGYSGVLLILNQMYRDTKIKEFKYASSILAEKISAEINLEDVLNFSNSDSNEWIRKVDIIEGVIGVFLTLINYKCSDADFINKLMLIK